MEGELETIMAGLNCGTPSEHGWRILKGSSDAFLSCDDRITVIGMRKLYYPSGNQTHNNYTRYFTCIIIQYCDSNYTDDFPCIGFRNG